MSAYQRLAEETRSSRRTTADALEVLCSAAGFDGDYRATIDVGAMKLPSGQIVGLVQILFTTTGKIYIVSLPTSTAFQAICEEDSRRETFDIFRLDSATVDCNGHVHLKDGVRLRAVTVIPALLPLEPSELDWRIVHATVRAIGAEKRCYRRLTDRAPGRFRRLRQHNRPRILRKTMPDQWFIDCRALRGLSTPPLKELIYRLAAMDPELKKISGQKISDALCMFGIRIPAPRPGARTTIVDLPQLELDQIWCGGPVDDDYRELLFLGRSPLCPDPREVKLSSVRKPKSSANRRRSIGSQNCLPPQLPWPIEMVPLQQLRPARRNPKTHPEKQIELLVKNIHRFGYTNPALADEYLNIIGGHARTEAATRASPTCWALSSRMSRR